MKPHHLACVFVVSVVGWYLGGRIDQGWIPHDEGFLGQSAERVLMGEYPHRDFDDPYTGGLSFMHAGAFQLLGIRLNSLRILLLVFSLVFTAVYYFLALRGGSAISAVAITLTAVAWSVPNYFAAMPSWYNLFFAAFGTYALTKYDETGGNRWLFVAGMMGGFSVLMKITGLYFVAASLLYFVYREQELRPSSDMGATSRAYSWFSTCSLLTFVLALGRLIQARFTAMDVLHFLAPGAVLSLFLVGNEWRQKTGCAGERFRKLFRMLQWYGMGLGLPIGLFLIPYFAYGELPALLHDVFVLPQKRMEWSGLSLPSTWSLLSALPWGVVLLVPFFIRKRYDHWPFVVGAAVLGLWGVLFGATETVYVKIWEASRPLVPIITLIGCGVLNSRFAADIKPPARRLVFLLMSVTAMVSLVQYPYSSGIYFCYTAPMVILATAHIVRIQPNAPQRIHLCVLAFYFGFALLWLNHGHFRRLGIRFVPLEQDSLTEMDRMQFRVSASSKRLYEAVVAEIQGHSNIGESIYATADCPEIYFLSNRNNPTRTFFDFFDLDFQGPTESRLSRIRQLLDDHQVRVVVFRWGGEFSGSPTRAFAGELAKLFPNVKHFVRDPDPNKNPIPDFSVAWRDEAPPKLGTY